MEPKGSPDYVLNLSDRTFREFFSRELNIDIDEEIYARQGSSKGKRLRCFLQTVDDPTAVLTLRALWEYREAIREHYKTEEDVTNGHARLLDLIIRLEGGNPAPSPQPPSIATSATQIAALRQSLLDLAKLDPQPRGYAFEKFLKTLFDVFGMAAREPFRIRGEQIDGSFQARPICSKPSGRTV